MNNSIKTFAVGEQGRLSDALTLAKRAHQGQKRDEGDPYVIHPIRIANMLISDLKVTDGNIIIAALLHDVVEDTGITLEEIKEKFGEEVGELVHLLTRDKEKETKKEKFEKTLRGSAEDKLLKACDYLDNLRSLLFRTDREERWQRHLREAEEMYIPMAEATRDEWLISEMKKAYRQALSA